MQSFLTLILMAHAAILSFTPAALTQSSDVFVQGWGVGLGNIEECNLDISLNSERSSYLTVLRSPNSGRRFQLIVLHNSIKNEPVEHWEVRLQEILESARGNSGDLGPNLLRQTRPDAETDYFPRGDLVGYLSPKLSDPVKRELPFYPLASKRIVKIGEFSITIKVADSKFDLVNADRQSNSFIRLLIQTKNEHPKSL